MSSRLAELQARAREARDRVFADPSSSEKDRKYAQDVLTFYLHEDAIKHVSKSVVFATFRFLEIPVGDYMISTYNDLYYELMDEVNRVYKLIDLETRRQP